MSGFDREIMGVRVQADFSLPLSNEELLQAGSDYAAFQRNGYGDSEECDEFGRAMEDAGYWPKGHPDDDGFTFVPL